MWIPHSLMLLHNTCLLTCLLTPWYRVLLEQLFGLQLVKKFPAFHRTRRFITALTSVHHLSLFWASPIQSIYPHPTSCRSIHLHVGLLPSGFPTKTLYTPLSSPICATSPAHPILLHFITRTILGEQYKSFSSSLCSVITVCILRIPQPNKTQYRSHLLSPPRPYTPSLLTHTRHMPSPSHPSPFYHPHHIG